MSGRYLLDTSIIVDYFANDPSVVANIDNADAIFVSSIALGELQYGSYLSKNPQKNDTLIEAFVQRIPVLSCDIRTAFFYAQVKFRLKKKGRPIPENDVWIAALARQYDLTLATRDNHFKEVDELQVAYW